MKTQSLFETIITKFFDHNKITIILFFFLAALSLYYTFLNIKVVTDTDQLIDNELMFKKQQRNLKENFPILSNNILIFMESKNRKILYEEGEKIKNKLDKMTDKLDFIYSPNTDKFYKKHLFKIMSTEQKNQILDKLYLYQPFLSEISNNPKMKGVNNLLSLAISKYNTDKDVNEFNNINTLLDAFYISLKNEDVLDWNKIFNNSNYEYYLVLKINEQYLKQNGFKDFYQLLLGLKKNKNKDLEISFTGGKIIDYEETESVIKNSGKAGFLSLIIVALILWIAFRNIYVILSLLISIVIGLSITLGITTLTVGKLNIISTAFAILFIGISVDFGIQYCLRTLETKKLYISSLKTSIFSISSSLIIVTITSMVGFLSFIPTDYVGLSELGMISSIGLIVGLIVNITFLPSLLKFFFKFINYKDFEKLNLKYLIRGLSLQKKTITLFLILIGLLGTYSLLKIKFDSDPMKLKDQNSQSVQLAYKLMDKNPSSDYTISIIKNNKVKKNDILELQKSDLIKEVNHIEKLNLDPDLIESMDYLSFLLTPIQNKFYSSELELNNFIGNLKKIISLNVDDASKNARKIINLLEKNQTPFKNIQDLFFMNFDNLINEILILINTSQVNENDVPKFYLSRFVSESGLTRFEVFPSKDMTQLNNLDNFVNYVHKKFPNATGMPIVQLEAGKVVISSFIFALSISVSFLILFIFTIFRNFKNIIYCLLPLIFSIFLISIFMRILGLNLNFANMIALPLLFSLGSSYSIYIIRRIRDLKSVDKMLESNTPSAVFFSSLTTIGSFGTFSISSHYGTASMGILLFISLLCAQLSCIVLLPLIIKVFRLRI